MVTAVHELAARCIPLPGWLVVYKEKHLASIRRTFLNVLQYTIWENSTCDIDYT